MLLKHIKKVHELKKSVEAGSRQYYHSRPLITSRPKLELHTTRPTFTVEYSIKDLLLIGAITENPVLLIGGTDLGKTYLARLVMQGLFGKEEQGWHQLDFDLDFGKDAYTNVNSDFFHESGKNLNDLYSLHEWMRLPGFIADELNGVHPKIVRKALHIIREKEITLSNGQRKRIGHGINDHDETYQFQVATINEGSEYSGTFDMDKALRRRTTIEIPMDIFSPTPFDRLCIQKFKQKEAVVGRNNISEVLDVFTVPRLDLHPTAELFVSYLEAFDYCASSLTEDKGSVAQRNGSIAHICGQQIRAGDADMGNFGCFFLRAFPNNLCPNVRGITPGVSENVLSVAHGLALLRAVKFIEMIAGFIQGAPHRKLSYTAPANFENLLRESFGQGSKKDLAAKAIEKYISELEIQQQDITAAVNFVGYSKIGINPTWVNKFYQGNKFEAVKNFCAEAERKFLEGLNRPELENLQELLTNKNGTGNLRSVIEYCRSQNPWLLRALSPYLEEEEQYDESLIEDLYQ